MKKIIIRADGSSEIGMGHIMRCICLGKVLNENNIEVLFLTKQNEMVIDLLKNNKIKFKIIKSKSLIDEQNEIVNIAKEKNIKNLLTDSYGLNDLYLIYLKKYIKVLISIDDNSLYNYPNDILINPNIYANDLKFNLSNPNCIKLTGKKYIILREEFRKNLNYKLNTKINNILITMGGSDINNYTKVLINYLNDLDFNFNVIIGKNFTNIDELKKIVNEKFKLIYNPNNISQIMLKSDLAISASGSTVYELASIGVPTLLIIQSDNQKNIANYFNNIMINIGKYDEINKKNLIDTINFLNENYNERNIMSIKSKQEICKNGVENIVLQINDIIK